MARTAKRPRAERKPARFDRPAPSETSRELVVAGALSTADNLPAPPGLPALPGILEPLVPPDAADRATRPASPAGPAWLARNARLALWALPGYALAYLWLTARPVPDPMADPVAWAELVTGDGYLRFQLLAGLGSALLGVVAVLALVLLLANTEARWVATFGLLVALVAAGLQAFRLGVAGLAGPALGEQFQAGDVAAAYAYQQAYAPGGPLVVDGPLPPAGWLLLAGSVLVTLTWLLLAWAARRSGWFGRLDVLLLAVAAPLLGLAGGVLPLLVPLGALLLLAAGVGIAWSGRRLGPADAGWAQARSAAPAVGVG